MKHLVGLAKLAALFAVAGGALVASNVLLTANHLGQLKIPVGMLIEFTIFFLMYDRMVKW